MYEMQTESCTRVTDFKLLFEGLVNYLNKYEYFGIFLAILYRKDILNAFTLIWFVHQL